MLREKVDHGAVALFRRLRENAPVEIRVFHDMAAACRWLGLDSTH